MARKQLLIVDIETTGLYPESGHVILSIGAIAERKVTKSSPEPFVEFYGVIKPSALDWQRASEEALKVNGMTFEYLQQFQPLASVRDDFVRWLMENNVSQRTHVWLGQNPSFDIKFLRHYMGAELKFVNAPLDEPLDIRDLYDVLANRRKVPILKYRSGQNISRALGVREEPEVHNALEGARVVQRNYNAMVEMGLYS